MGSVSLTACSRASRSLWFNTPATMGQGGAPSEGLLPGTRCALSIVIKARENVKANNRKIYFDHKHSVKVTKVNVGDWVMIKRPGFQSGGNKLSKPMKVIKIFNNAIRTDDHRVRNLNRVVPYRGKEMRDAEDAEENDNSSLGKDNSSTEDFFRRSDRKTQRPVYLKDYM
ncbi:hypothetical protein NDU88_000750 [Pleurodeles waltl]|uniref:Uncharacterized protein n=1 Tax=Pleurodeles waltl TaxID=8319 RepID=A0AAV7UQU9_PLEWA|nr:hypothetical protein NDU88_000750 [Pleurodeles waltl]